MTCQLSECKKREAVSKGAASFFLNRPEAVLFDFLLFGVASNKFTGETLAVFAQ